MAATLSIRRPTLTERALAYLNGVAVVTEIELRKIRHDPLELVTRAAQPLLWLLVFGEAFSRLHAIRHLPVDYLTFMTPGILAQSLMFISIFYGLNVIWERDQGILQKFLVLPVPRGSFVTGKGLGAGARAVAQVIVVLLVALLLGVHIRWSVGGIIGSLLTVIVGAAIFTTLSMLIAILVKTRERFMGVGQIISMPLFFASNAIYPLSIMPLWLHVLALINPMSYIVDLLRGYLVLGSPSHGLLDWAVLIAFVIVAQALAGQTYQAVVLE